ncbi:YrhB family protein [Streptomyces avidinii]|uniref:YrhB domain-containing protein n=1 Tax=Streptomyces avidinii TaxID=1895 RepID=UPI003865321F|nr:YrhB family protein [Streptomyces avidinii]
MVGRDSAIRIVEEELDRDYRRELAIGLDPIRTAIVQALRHELVWIVSWTSEEYLRTRKPSSALVGNGPYLVDRVDGGLHQIDVVPALTGVWERDYRVHIRGETERTAVDDLHDEVGAVTSAGGRLRALRVLRRKLPVLTPAQAIEYVTALTEGDAPAHIVEVAVRELVPPTERFVHTIRAPGNQRTH